MATAAAASTTNSTLLHLGLIESLSSSNINTWAIHLGKTAIKLWSSLQCRYEHGNTSNTLCAETRTPVSGLPNTRQNFTFGSAHYDSICREDVEIVMRNLGLGCSGEVQERFEPEAITKQFEEKEPSLEEVKEAFDVFDVNRDGFIDAEELHRVLCVLGFGEVKDVEESKKMIRSFDENGDGRIDFREFIKLMEHCFC